MTGRRREGKGCDGRDERPPGDLPPLHGRWGEHRRCGGRNEVPGQERPPFYMWWFVKRERRKEDAGEERIRRVCVAKERMHRRGTAAPRGRRDRDARPGASEGSGGRRRPRTLGRGRSPCRNEEEEKEKGTTAEGSVRPPPERTTGIYPGRACRGATTGPGRHPGR